MKTETQKNGRTGDKLDALVGQFRAIESELMKEMRRVYPAGTRVAFWRSSGQRNESFGTIIGHSMGHGPELRVRYDNSNHVVGLHVGYTKFHSLPNASGQTPAAERKDYGMDR